MDNRTPKTISGALITTVQKMSKQSTHDRSKCRCGNTIEPSSTKLQGRVMYPPRCRACDALLEAKEQAKELRTTRRRKQHVLRSKINAVIPELYRNARIRCLSKALKCKLLELIDTDQGAFLYGQPGVGKTFSMCAAARKLITEGAIVQRVVWDRLTLKIRGSYTTGGGSEDDIINPLIESDVLFIEDIGTTTSQDKLESDFNVKTLLAIIDTRLEACKPTWITSNKSIEQLGRSFDDRIASRLHQHCKPLLVEGVDRRR